MNKETILNKINDLKRRCSADIVIYNEDSPPYKRLAMKLIVLEVLTEVLGEAEGE